MTVSTAQVLAANSHLHHHFPAISPPIALSQRLRENTSALHKQVEDAADLPGCVVNLDDYAACLTRFLALFAPLEAGLAAWDEWESIGINLPSRCRTASLLLDLQQLGRLPAAPEPVNLAPFPSFPAALGCLYVLEGSTLGGKFLLRAFTQRLGAEIHGASSFFAGHGAAAGAAWNQFRAALDDYGATYPAKQADVLAGAADTFRHFATKLAAPVTRPA
jgi:heme oxygenase